MSPRGPNSRRLNKRSEFQPVRGELKNSTRAWQCTCGHWNTFGGWYAAHAHEVLTATCERKECGLRYGSTNYKVWPL